MFFKHNQFTIAIFVAIVLICMLPGNEVPELEDQVVDKYVHAVLFGLLSYCMIIGFVKQFQYARLARHAVGISVVFSILFGILIELFQYGFLEGRTFDLLDIAADLVGVLIGFVSFVLVRGKKGLA